MKRRTKLPVPPFPARYPPVTGSAALLASCRRRSQFLGARPFGKVAPCAYARALLCRVWLPTETCSMAALPARSRAALSVILSCAAALILGTAALVPALAAQSSTPPRTRSDSIASRKADSVAKAAAKAKPSTVTPAAGKTTAPTTARPASTAATKAATTTAPTKAATTTAPTKAATTKTDKAASPPTTSRPVTSGAATAPRRAPPKAVASKSSNAIIPLDDGGHAVSLYGGASAGALGFGTGPVVGVVWRIAAPTSATRLRADIIGAHYSQTAPAFAGSAPIAQQASLTHAGVTVSLDFSPIQRRTMRPYLTVGGGVMRFQASGPAGANGTIANGVFTSTTDVAGVIGAGLQLNSRIYIEGRYMTVGDFHSIPFTAGVRF